MHVYLLKSCINHKLNATIIIGIWNDIRNENPDQACKNIVTSKSL